MSSPAAPLTPPLVREANHAERNDAAAISEMMPEVYEDLRRLAESFLRDERTAHTLQRTALVHEAFLRLIGKKNLVWQDRDLICFSITAPMLIPLCRRIDRILPVIRYCFTARKWDSTTSSLTRTRWPCSSAAPIRIVPGLTE